jgi:hypothetical protein
MRCLKLLGERLMARTFERQTTEPTSALRFSTASLASAR